MLSKQQIEFFLSSSKKIVELELFEVKHPDFLDSYKFVRNAISGITLSNGLYFKYYPASIKKLTNENNLDYGLKMSLGDLSEVIPPEIESLRSNNSLSIKPIINHWLYRSDNLEEPMEEILNLEMDDFSFDSKRSYFVAKAPALNNTKTGKTYNVEDFSMLEGFL